MKKPPALTTRRSWLSDESAVTSIEYALLGALIAVVIIGALSLNGDALKAIYQFWSNAVAAAL